jgi:hypothetical protein
MIVLPFPVVPQITFDSKSFLKGWCVWVTCAPAMRDIRESSGADDRTRSTNVSPMVTIPPAADILGDGSLLWAGATSPSRLRRTSRKRPNLADISASCQRSSGNKRAGALGGQVDSA